jgi:ribosomal protein L36
MIVSPSTYLHIEGIQRYTLIIKRRGLKMVLCSLSHGHDVLHPLLVLFGIGDHLG